jgi:hypothetical protein
MPPATQNPTDPLSAGSTTPIVAPRTHASCRNVSDRPNALDEFGNLLDVHALPLATAAWNAARSGLR